MSATRITFEVIPVHDENGKLIKTFEVTSFDYDNETPSSTSSHNATASNDNITTTAAPSNNATTTSTPSNNTTTATTSSNNATTSTASSNSTTTSTASVIHQLNPLITQQITIQQIPAPLLQSGNNIAVLRHYDNEQKVKFDEVLILNMWDKFQNTLPKKLIVLDMDETFIMNSENAFLFTDTSLQHMSKIAFLQEEYLLELMNDLVTEKTMIVIVTKRLSYDNGNQFFAALPIAQELERRCCKQIFPAIYFTNAQTKVPALEHLYNEYLEPQGLDRNALSFADDLSNNLAEANAAGFDNTIIATPNGAHYDKIYAFATGKTRDLDLTPEEKAERNFAAELSFENFRL